MLFFLPDPAAALRAWLRLLVPGGRLGVTTYGPSSPGWETVDAVFEPNLSSQAQVARTSGRRGPFASDEGVEGLLVDAGFAEVRTVTSVVQVRFDNPDHWYRWTLSGRHRDLWQAVPTDEREKVRAEAYRSLDVARAPDGQLGFDQQVRFTLGRR